MRRDQQSSALEMATVKPAYIQCSALIPFKLQAKQKKIVLHTHIKGEEGVLKAGADCFPTDFAFAGLLLSVAMAQGHLSVWVAGAIHQVQVTAFCHSSGQT